MTVQYPSLRRSWVTIVVLACTGILAVGQTYVVLGLVESMAHGLSTPAAAVPTATTVFGLAYAAGFLLAGPLAAKFGARRVLLLGLAGAAVATVAAGLATTFEAELVLRGIQGAVTASFAPCALMWIAQQMPVRLRSSATTALTASFFASTTLLPMIAHSLPDRWGWRTMFFIGGASLLLCCLILTALLRPSLVTPGLPLNAAMATLFRVVRRPRMLLLFAATTVVLGAYVALFVAIERFPSPAVLDFPGGVQGLRALSLVALVIATAVAGALTVVPARWRAGGGFMLVCIASGGVALAPTPLILGGAVIVFVAAIALTAPAVIECIVSTAPSEETGAAMGWYGAFTFLGGSLGPTLPAVTQGLPGNVGLIAAAAIVGSSLMLASRVSRRPSI